MPQTKARSNQGHPTASVARGARTFDRFIAAIEDAAKMQAHAEHTMSDLGVQHAIEYLKEAEPVARAIALLGNPLYDSSEILTAFMRRKAEEARVAANDPKDPECDVRAAEEDALYSVGLALGLILADQV
jgi:hypothetical protein